MTREEELKKLESMSNFFCSMSDDEFFDYLYENSPSFKSDVDNLESTFDVVGEVSITLNKDANYSVRYRKEEYFADEKTYKPMTAEEMQWLMVA
ncbi:MAG: hypothetical protein IJ158_14475 [Treponema sp.]|nr:hypothetical protein [Treponema sp.]